MNSDRGYSTQTLLTDTISNLGTKIARFLWPEQVAA